MSRNNCNSNNNIYDVRSTTNIAHLGNTKNIYNKTAKTFIFINKR